MLQGKEHNKDFKIGDCVYVLLRDQEGWIIDKNGDFYMVSMAGGSRVDSFLAADLELVTI